MDNNSLVNIRLKFSKRSRELGVLSPAELKISKEDALYIGAIKLNSFCKNQIERSLKNQCRAQCEQLQDETAQPKNFDPESQPGDYFQKSRQV